MSSRRQAFDQTKERFYNADFKTVINDLMQQRRSNNRGSIRITSSSASLAEASQLTEGSPVSAGGSLQCFLMGGLQPALF